MTNGDQFLSANLITKTVSNNGDKFLSAAIISGNAYLSAAIGGKTSTIFVTGGDQFLSAAIKNGDQYLSANLITKTDSNNADGYLSAQINTKASNTNTVNADKFLSATIGSGYSSSNTVGSHITSLESTISSCVLIDKSNNSDAVDAYTDTNGNIVIYNPNNNTIKSTRYGISNNIESHFENGNYEPGAGATGYITTEQAVANYVKDALTWQEIPDEEEP